MLDYQLLCILLLLLVPGRPLHIPATDPESFTGSITMKCPAWNGDRQSINHSIPAIRDSLSVDKAAAAANDTRDVPEGSF